MSHDQTGSQTFAADIFNKTVELSVAVLRESCSRFCLFAQFAAVETNVLLLGQSGTGKEVVARFTHRGRLGELVPFVRWKGRSRNRMNSDHSIAPRHKYKGRIFMKN